jgi:hypothetical protein
MVSLDSATQSTSPAGVNGHATTNGNSYVNGSGEKPLDITVLGMNSGTSMVGELMSPWPNQESDNWTLGRNRLRSVPVSTRNARIPNALRTSKGTATKIYQLIYLSYFPNSYENSTTKSQCPYP